MNSIIISRYNNIIISRYIIVNHRISLKHNFILFLDPKFKEPITNVTAPVGREAILSCVVQDLAGYKVMKS